MPITDDRSSSAAPPPSPPSFVRRHPIMAGFGVLSGLSLFSALWPVSAIVTAVVVAGHATGLDRAAWSLVRTLATRVTIAAHHHLPGMPLPSPDPAPAEPAPSAPEPPAPSPPRREVHPPAVTTDLRHGRRVHAPESRPPARSRRGRTAEHRVESGVDGPGV